MFGPVQPTRYDLVFSLFGIPVRVVWTFWIFAALLGGRYLSDPVNGFVLILIWIGVVFVSILVHEMGHALTAKLFGYPPRIMIYHFGGLAMYEPYYNYTTARAILITLAGPGAGLALGACAFAVMVVLSLTNGDQNVILFETVFMFFYANIFWSILNLMPVLPLDGGNVCREVCVAMNPHRGLIWALWISIVVGGLIGLGLVAIRFLFGGIMFLMIALQNYQQLQQRRWYS